MPRQERTKLWLLRPVEVDGKVHPEWKPWYDKTFGVVVRAPDEKAARAWASTESGDEGREVWLDPNLTTCVELLPAGTSGVVIKDFWAA